MIEWIVPDTDLGVDGAYFGYDALLRCKHCKYWDGYYCHHPGYGDGHAHYTPPIKTESGYCDWAEKRRVKQ